MAPWRRKFSRLNVLLNVMFITVWYSRGAGVCWIDEVFVTELSVVIFFFHTAVLSIKTAFNLVKVHLLFRIMLLIQWNIICCPPCYRFLETEIYKSVSWIYADIHVWKTNEYLCSKLKYIYKFVLRYSTT